jgi:hypothetical protein
MYNLYATYYDATSPSLFEKDLDDKDWVVVLREESGMLVGFSSLAIVDAQSAGVACALSIPATPSSTAPTGAPRRLHSPGFASPAPSRRKLPSGRSTGF